MRKYAVLAASAVLMTAGLSTSAWAAEPEAPTDVQVAWAGDKIRVTWKDNGDANEVWTRYPGTGFVETSGRTAAGAENVLLIDRSRFMDLDRVLIRVFARTAAGENGPSATSVEFDSRIPVYPIIEDADLLADGSVHIGRWTQPAVVDVNPGDPLDRPDEYLGAQIAVPGSPTKERMLIPAGATSFTVPPRARPATITLYAGNEWRESFLSNGNGPWLERKVEVGTLSASFVVPAMGLYSLQLGIESTLKSNLTNITPQVQLQARPNSASPWKTYGRYTGTVGKSFDTHMASLGERQYRLWVPPSKKIEQAAIKLTPAASTTARTSRTTANVIFSGMQPYDAVAGQLVTMKVWAQPAVNMKAALQRRDGRTWKYVRELPLTNGRTTVQFRATRQSQTWYRVLTPPVKVNGLPVLAGASLDYAFTVR